MSGFFGGHPWSPYASPQQPRFVTSLFGPVVCLAAPGGQLLSLPAARRHLRCDDDDTTQDLSIQDWIIAAQEYCERAVDGQVSLLTASYSVPVLDWWYNRLSLPRAPHLSVDGIDYYDTAGVLQTLSPTIYTVQMAQARPATIYRAPNKSWPAYQADTPFPINIRFTSGCLSTYTVNPTTNVLTSTGRAFNTGERVRVSNLGGAVPAGLVVDTDYWTVATSGQTLQLSASPGGSAVDVTDAGSGLNQVGIVPNVVKQALLLLTSYWDQNREAALVDNRAASKEISFSVNELLALLGFGYYG